jgi:hypothetical protein
MTYYEDGSSYSYLAEFVDGSVNVGWLDSAMPIPTGDFPDEFVDRLTELCRYPVNLTRGWHRCNLCPPSEEPGRPSPTTVTSPDGEYLVGHGEIRVEGEKGARYAAPDMIVHYVREHGYQPPDYFIDAVLSLPRP